MSIAQHDDDSYAELIQAHEGHLRQLYLTRATMGAATPPHIHTEIARIEREVDRIQTRPQPMDTMTIYRLLAADIMRLDAAIGSLRRLVEDDLLGRAHRQVLRPRTTRNRTVNGGD